MEKARIYELAKELNTTSKRLMEKLAEININVKNHMSLLEPHELDALYKHIGVIKHDDKKNEVEEKKAISESTHTTEKKKDTKKDTRSAPRIIRTTEIIIDSKTADASEVSNFSKNESKNVPKKNYRNDYVKTESSTSGLRPGFVRDVKPDFRSKQNVVSDKTAEIQKVVPKETDTPNEEALNRIKTLKTEDIHKEENIVAENNRGNESKILKDSTIAEPAQTDKNVAASEKEEPQNTNKPESAQKTAQPEIKPQKGNVAMKPEETAVSETKASEIKPAITKNETQQTQSNVPVQEKSVQKADKPQGQNTNQYSDRPHYNNQRSDRPQGQYNNQRSDRPQGQYNNQRSDRPQGQYNNQRSDRPQGQYNNQRSDRPQGQYGAKRTDRPQGQSRPQNLDIPKPDASVAQENFDSQRNEARREFQGRDFDKSVKREEKQKKEAPKSTTNTKQRFRPQKIVIEKKGVSEILSEDYIFNEFYNDDGKKKKQRNRRNEKVQEKYIPPKAVLTSITIPESLTVKDLAESLKKTSTEIIKKLMAYGVMATLNNIVDFETAFVIAEEYGVKAEKAIQISEEDILFDDAETEDESKLQSRPPVVVVMGHVDHGKTSLLDAIRSAHVIDSEAGGITQHIGAYTVKANDRLITFLDTPGHEAFTAMRARGAQVTDIAILVVAADDGVMPQTIEAINHAKAANVSIIVAINKIDKPGANPDKVKQELTEYGIVAEEWGGDAIMVPVSAKKRENIDQLLEMVLLAADMLELRADPERQAKGTVIEAKLDKERGPVATVLVQRGTLKTGDSLIAGSTFGRIKAMTSDKGHAIKAAGPSMPVEILGMDEVPEAGEVFYAVTDEKVAKQLVEKRKFRQKEQQFKSSAKVTLEDLFTQIKEGKVKDLNIIIKADVQGSVEAVKQSLEKLSNEEVRVKTIHGAVGAITESDVTLAQVSNAIIIGFNVRPGANVAEAAQNAEVDMRLYSVIYKAIEDVQSAMKGMLEPTYKEVVLGHIEIRQTFKVSGVGTIGGAYVTDGKVQRTSEVRVVREGIVIHEGKLGSLKRFKDDVKEVVQGYECGVSIENFNDIKEGDVIEAFVMEEVKR
ncbi:MAG TPA: translation initiation factor IF-2 [Ruminiclostridium sp.]|nr:translation initiation factor IF-2 [Ruminiclostridium sp.]